MAGKDTNTLSIFPNKECVMLRAAGMFVDNDNTYGHIIMIIDDVIHNFEVLLVAKVSYNCRNIKICDVHGNIYVDLINIQDDDPVCLHDIFYDSADTSPLSYYDNSKYEQPLYNLEFPPKLPTHNHKGANGNCVFDVVDSTETAAARMEIASGAIQLKFTKVLTDYDTKMLLSNAVLLCKKASICFEVPLPVIRVSKSMQHDAGLSQFPTFRYHDLSYLEHIKCKAIWVRAAGYNSHLNIVYFDVMKHTFRDRRLLTLECTPKAGRRGLTKFVAKSSAGDAIFSAVEFPQQKALAIYSGKNILLAYQHKDKVMDGKGKTIVNIEERLQSDRYGVKFCLTESSTDKSLTTITAVNKSIRIEIRTKKLEGRPPLVIAILIAVALKLYYDAYEFDSSPIPEITYHYSGRHNKLSELF